MMLTGRLILVTGGSSGIGRALTLSYLDHGAEVWTVARRASLLGETLTGDRAARGHPVPADLTQHAGREAVAAALVGRHLDVVVHAAGMLGPRLSLADYPEDAWHSVFRINMTAVHLLHQRLAGLLSPTAVIIGVSSTVGRTGRGGWGMYAVSKGALETWLEVLADEWPGRVYSVNPGGTATPMRSEAVPEEDPSSIPSPADIVPLFLRLAHPLATEPSGSKLNARDWIGRDPWEGIEGQRPPR